MITITVAISFVVFVTSADSGTVVLSTLSSHGGEPYDDGPRWLRVFWACSLPWSLQGCCSPAAWTR